MSFSLPHCVFQAMVLVLSIISEISLLVFFAENTKFSYFLELLFNLLNIYKTTLVLIVILPKSFDVCISNIVNCYFTMLLILFLLSLKIGCFLLSCIMSSCMNIRKLYEYTKHHCSWANMSDLIPFIGYCSGLLHLL